MVVRWIAVLVVLMVLAVARNGECSWQGPVKVLSGAWGDGERQFGIERGQVTIWGPLLTAVLGDGRFIVSDEINAREKVYDRDGSLLRVIPWMIRSDGTTTINPDYTLHRYADIAGYSAEGNIWLGSHMYILRSPDGQILREERKAPPELGLFRRERDGRGAERFSLVYPDRVYSVDDREYPKRIRDRYGALHFQEDRSIVRIGACGNVVGRLVVSESPADAVLGVPLIGPDGTVYAGRRSEIGFSVVKWTWRDDPNSEGGPDAPSALMTASTSLGLFLTWKQSPHDPGCVTGYEIGRATSSGGPYSAIATQEKGVLKYNDRTAEPERLYYYKVRAMAGNEYSKYSEVAEGKR